MNVPRLSFSDQHLKVPEMIPDGTQDFWFCRDDQ